MNFQELLGPTTDTPVTRAALIGVGQFGRTLLSQSARTEAMTLSVLCDRDTARAVDACSAIGRGRGDYVVADSREQAMRALESGRMVITGDAALAIDLPLDVVVEATGHAEAGARNCLAAIDAGRHIVLATKETDSVIGPLLSHRARGAGLVVSQVDGDQPSLLLALISWARCLGLEIACAGKASEHDFVLDPASGVVTADGGELNVVIDPGLWDSVRGDAKTLVARRADAMRALPQRTPPAFCEMCLVANGSGLQPDRPELHAAIARPRELPEILRPRAAGGILDGEDRLDVFNCFRRDDEISFAGGVFAVLKVPDKETGRLFQSKGIPVSADAGHVLVYNPTHLLGVEAPMSIMAAHRLNCATGSSSTAPVCDVVMRANRDLPRGTLLADLGHHHRIDGVDPLLLSYTELHDDAPLPYFMGMNRALVRDVQRGAIISAGAIEKPARSTLWALRAEQDRTFAG